MRVRNSRSCESFGGVARAHQNDAAAALPDQLQAAEYECAHEDLAQFGVPGDEGAQPFAGQFEKFTGLGDAAEHEAALAGNHGHFSGELARTVLCDGALAGKIRLDDLHGPGQQDEKRHVGVAGREKHLAWLDPAQFAGAFDPGDLRRRKDRKSLGVDVKSAGYWRSGHTCPPLFEE